MLSLADDRSFLFNINAQTFINAGINLLNVAILALVLAYVLYKPIRKVLQKRTERIQGQLLQAEEEMTKATELRRLYEQKMEDVDREREDILNDARKQASETGRRLVADAKAEADAVKERAAQNVAMEWERAQGEMRNAIIDVSSVMAEKFVTLAINKETHDRIFAEAVSDLEGMTWRD